MLHIQYSLGVWLAGTMEPHASCAQTRSPSGARILHTVTKGTRALLTEINVQYLLVSSLAYELETCCPLTEAEHVSTSATE